MTDLSSLATYVVSVKAFKDRHSHIRSQSEHHDLNLEFLWDFGIDSMTGNDLSRMDEKLLLRKSISTVLKHMEAKRRSIASSDRFALVLPDDAILFPEFSASLNQF